MARWATLIEQRRDERPVLLVDTGNFCARERSKSRDEQDLLFFEAMRLLSYDALTVGENEILFGRKRLLEAAGKNQLELVSANILDKSSREPIAQPYVIREIGGTNLLFARVGALKIGIFGITQPALVYSADRLTRDYYEIEEPSVAALRTVSELRARGCDMVVVLSHQVWDQSVTLANRVPGIDLIISSHRISTKTHAEMHGGALIVGPGEKMTSFTEISADWDGGRWQISTIDRGKELLETAEHPDFVRIEREYQKTVGPRPLEEKH